MLHGRRIIALTFVASLGIAGVGVALAGTGPEGALWLTRATARVSLLLFVLTASASSINGLLRNATGKWLLRNRRHLGLSFALSHGIHALAFFWYAHERGVVITELVQGTTLWGGSLGYGFIAAMAITSTDAAVRALGRRRWVVLHRAGMLVLFVIFVFSYLGPALRGEPLGIAATTVLALVGGLRATHRIRLMRRARRRGTR